jgi:hypothetical protein
VRAIVNHLRNALSREADCHGEAYKNTQTDVVGRIMGR